MTITNSYFEIITLYIKILKKRKSKPYNFDTSQNQGETLVHLKKKQLHWKIWILDIFYLIISLYKTFNLILEIKFKGNFDTVLIALLWDVFYGASLIEKIIARTNYKSSCIAVQHNLLVSYENEELPGNLIIILKYLVCIKSFNF